MSVAVEEEPVSLASGPREAAAGEPAVKHASTSPAAQPGSPASPESSISDTANEPVSEGQWLLSGQSEGEIKSYALHEKGIL